MSNNCHNPNLCKKCGKCCYIKTIVAGIPVFTRHYCEYLDLNTRLCKIYKNRFKKNKNCLTIEEAISIKALPNDCPYVKDIKDYKGPIWPD